MQGVITRVQVLAHPVVILESFGVKVLVRALFADARETFLDVVSRCAEEEAHLALEDVDLLRTVNRFVGYERRVGDLYRHLAGRLAADAEAAEFFRSLSLHEEGHAIVLLRVRREIRKGHLWKASRDLHLGALETLEDGIAAREEEVRRGVTLARALDIVEELEGSEINVVFDALSACVDMRSRARFERFFVLTHHHLRYCKDHLRALRARRGNAVA